MYYELSLGIHTSQTHVYWSFMQAITTQFHTHEQAHWSSILLEKGVSFLPLALFRAFSGRCPYRAIFKMY
jgi:hypothetical protein